jgi:capsular exopolysaccharide synthesis family protein
MGGIGRRSVDNEVYIFESRHLMAQIVQRLDLMTRYTIDNGLSTKDLYLNTPAIVHFVEDGENIKGAFKYELRENNQVYINNFRDSDFECVATLGDTIATPLGKLVIEATPHSSSFINKRINVSHNTLNNTVEQYRKKLKCEIKNKQASVITLTMSDVVAKRAEDVINGIIEAYDADAIEDKQAISHLTKRFIDDRLTTLSQELNLADDDIATFKKSNHLYNLPNQATLSAQEIQELKREGLSLEANLEVANYIYDYTSTAPRLSLIPASVVSPGGSATPLASQIESYNRSLLEYQRLLSESSESNPTIIDLKAQLIAVRDIILSSLKSHIDGLKLQINSVEREYKRADNRLEQTPSKEKELLSKTRQQKVKEELYIYLLTKLEENALTGATAESNARVIDFAYGADKPVSPRLMIVYILALMMGCFIPFAIIYLREILNTSVRSRHDVEKALTAPYLGDIPLSQRRTPSMVQVKEDGRDTLSESFRILRTNLSFMSVNHTVKVIMLTSSIPHSGKTFVATNLAAMLAMGSKKVLLIDMDLRRRTLTKNLGHRNDRRGLSALLSGKFDSVNDIISKSEIDSRLDIIFAGPQPPNPSEILMSQRLDSLLSELRECYDYIIIDSVPALSVADAIITDRLVDLAIYIVRQGNLDRRQLPDIEQLHTSGKLHNMCVVLNGTTYSKHSYNYNYDTYDEKSGIKRNWDKVRKLFKR